MTSHQPTTGKEWESMPPGERPTFWSTPDAHGPRFRVEQLIFKNNDDALDFEVHDSQQDGGPNAPQARYLVHGHDDLLWTNSIDEALQFLRQSLEHLDADR